MKGVKGDRKTKKEGGRVEGGKKARVFPTREAGFSHVPSKDKQAKEGRKARLVSVSDRK